MAFLDRVSDDTTVAAQLLTSDTALQRRIEMQPTLAWRLQKRRDSRDTQQIERPRSGLWL